MRSNDLVDRILTVRLGPGANSIPPAEPPGPAAATETQAEVEAPVEQPVVDDPEPAEEQVVPVNGISEDEPENEPQPVAVDADSPQPVEDDTDDDVFDEPQPRSTRRRRPFTSRLLGR